MASIFQKQFCICHRSVISNRYERNLMLGLWTAYDLIFMVVGIHIRIIENTNPGINMNTLDLHKAADFLKIHPVTLQQKAKSGEIPGAKIGKCWVFIDLDLIEYIRSKYTGQGKQDVGQGETRPCSLKEKDQNIGITSLRLTEKQYSDLLEPKTKLKLKK